jgi:hypothetical protein
MARSWGATAWECYRMGLPLQQLTYILVMSGGTGGGSSVAEPNCSFTCCVGRGRRERHYRGCVWLWLGWAGPHTTRGIHGLVGPLRMHPQPSPAHAWAHAGCWGKHGRPARATHQYAVQTGHPPICNHRRRCPGTLSPLANPHLRQARRRRYGCVWAGWG